MKLFNWLIIPVIGLVFLEATHCQIGNEWIQFNQSHLKIKTGEDHIYKITYDQLEAAGLPLSSILPGRFKLFHRGTEQAIFVASQTDTPLQPGDYIEFYGIKNDGALDSDLYTEPQAQPHAHYNLYSDTTAYFLTWDPAGSGKRMDFIDQFNINNVPAEASHLNRVAVLHTSDYSQGRIYPQGGPNSETRLSVFDHGEGWTGPRILKGGFQDFFIEGLTNLVSSASDPSFELVLAGRNNRPHNFEILVGDGPANLRSLGLFTFNFYNNLEVQQSLAFSDIGANGSLTVRIRVEGFDNLPADAISLSHLEVRAPQIWDMESQDFKIFGLNPNPQGTSFISISNPPTDARIYDITDPENPIRIGYSIAAGSLQAIVPNTQNERKLLVIEDSRQVLGLLPVSFTNINPAQHTYAIISHPSLMQPAGGADNIVEEYANYRSSASGGGFSTLVLDIGEIYDRFNYGETSPRAIHKFMEFMWNGGNLDYLFLIGKSLTVDHDYHRKGPPEGTALKDLVPTAGFPGSDILFSAGLGNSTFEAAVPTGRIIAQTPDDVLAYLNKVREMEATPYDALWRKNLLHLSGGLTTSEVNRFLAYVNGYKSIGEGDYLGGKVITKSKEGNSSRELINVSDIVNEGVALITFYGHSAPNLTDIEIGDVSNPSLGYDNKGRYASILVNGCNAGNIFSTASSFGEDWILTPDLGAVSYLSHSATGFESALNRYSQTFYMVAFGDSSLNFIRIGDVQGETSSRFLKIFSTTETNISQVQQVVLQGDPASILFGAEKPDYRIGTEDLFLEGFASTKVTASEDSFRVALVVQNLGRTVPNAFSVVVARTANNGEFSTIDTAFFNPVKYLDTLYITLYDLESKGFGVNRFEVTVDPGNLIPELNELNNSAILTTVIPLGGTTNLFPADYGLVGETDVTLIAQAFDLRSDPRTFVFELDTVKSFQSGFRQTTTVEGEVLAFWTAQLPSSDSVVYYWRTRFLTPLPEEDTSWTVSSFSYIKDSPSGWSQSHFQQIEENSSSGMFVNPSNHNLEFNATSSTLEVTTHGGQSLLSDPINVELTINGQNFIVSSPANRICRDDAIAAVAFQKSTTAAYAVLADSGFDVLDPERCGITPQVINSLRNVDIEGTSARLSAFLDLIPDGDHVLLFSIGEVTFENWDTDLITRLEGIGALASSVSSLLNGEPWILLGRKGLAPGAAQEVRADVQSSEPVAEQEIQLSAVIQGRTTQGSLTTALIGPAGAWDRLDQKLLSSDNPVTDQNSVRVTGIDLKGLEIVIQDSFQGNTLDLSQLEASSYPFLRLNLNTRDPDNLTPAQLKFWQVLHQGVPEGILLESTTEGEQDNSSQEGETLGAPFVFRNISTLTFGDSLVVEYSIFTRESRTLEDGEIMIAPPEPGIATNFSIPINTLGKVGTNDLTVNVNPQIELEQNYGNNVLTIPEYVVVEKDDSNPLLDITFDGRYIMDGEIVSPSPLILIKLIDENPILIKDDTIGVDIMLKSPCENCEFEKVNFSGSEISWLPAGVDSDFEVEYRPTSLPDGVYTLRVQASDESGNLAGANPYTIRFEVINESQITNFYPYPNPFSTSTRFVFTLTGSEIPDEIKIQIMTVSGIVVREITQGEIGPIRIGNNRTEYAWDGRDEFGDQLANGVYLYRVFVKSGGKLIDRRATSADIAFKQGFGKLYLLR